MDKNAIALMKRIRNLVKTLDAVVLAHNYQSEDVQSVADFTSDSLELSQKAAKIKQNIIVFAGVKFMAETAKILSPTKIVLLPRLDAGCPMADMVMPEDVYRLRLDHPNAKVVTYVNSSVEVKAESDVCCTSANAVSVVRNIPGNEIIFLPDQNLGAFVQKKVPEKRIILYEGHCYVHNRIQYVDVVEMKNRFPQALIVAHPEVKPEVSAIADEVLSTSGMLRFVHQSNAQMFIVLTEEALLQRMRHENPDKIFFSAGPPHICSNMKKTTLQDIERSLIESRYNIEIPSEMLSRASHALQEMLRYTEE